MTEKEALLWVLGVLASVCAGAVTLDKVLDIIHKYIKKAQAPDEAQNKRLDELELRLKAMERGYTQHGEALARDLHRFEEIDEVLRLNLSANRAILEAQLTGDNIPAMQKCKAEIDAFLEKGVTNHGSNA